MKPGDKVRIDPAVYGSQSGNVMIPMSGTVESVYEEDGDAVVQTRYGRIICEIAQLSPLEVTPC